MREMPSCARVTRQHALQQMSLDFPVEKKTPSRMHAKKKIEELEAEPKGICRAETKKTVRSFYSQPVCVSLTPRSPRKSPCKNPLSLNGSSSSPKKKRGLKSSTDEPDENVVSIVEKRQLPLQLCKPDVSAYDSVKVALHSSVGAPLIGREMEISFLHDFISENLRKKNSASLYVSGPPGTGKTASINHILENFKDDLPAHKAILINCMAVKNVSSVYFHIAKGLDGAFPCQKGEKETITWIENKITCSRNPILLVLDEVDQLSSRRQEILYRIFQWPLLPSSRLILIGVANALDLTDRMLPWLQGCVAARPQLFHFKSYSKDQILDILRARLDQAGDSQNVFHPLALRFLASKIAGRAGDIRMALDVCRRAVNLAEAKAKEQLVLQPVSNGKGQCQKLPLKEIGIREVSSLYDEATGSSVANLISGSSHEMPLQQKLAVATLLLITKGTKSKETTISKWHEVFRRVCDKRSVEGVSPSEFVHLVSLLDSHGILALKKKKDVRLSLASLRLDEGEVENARNHFMKLLKDDLLKPTAIAAIETLLYYMEHDQ
ncbi:unnamed protein product [Darwinula stevensoni]|uniref:Cell division control protein n=1 Tax=Darwinula stevensoni TaxID=69355 RepID=A0A7R9FN36_9CRUS|nr:unnamed protein product [Darwinula stevensoni]CAG0896228.1 unnamed protein product [Darwinula stevensoni]